jgi:hypothetical protein
LYEGGSAIRPTQNERVAALYNFTLPFVEGVHDLYTQEEK